MTMCFLAQIFCAKNLLKKEEKSRTVEKAEALQAYYVCFCVLKMLKQQTQFSSMRDHLESLPKSRV